MLMMQLNQVKGAQALSRYWERFVMNYVKHDIDSTQRTYVSDGKELLKSPRVSFL